jgi:phosphatidylserine/phosphatidylglycerophosphate/cardiolipin synthase-like enzyme
MRRFLFLFLILTPLFVAPARAFDLTLHDAPAHVYFSPHGGAQNAVVYCIGQARESVYVLAYSFTSVPITLALVDAAQRGVHVEAVLDRSQRTAKNGQGQVLANAGAKVYVDSRHAIAHNKVMILDGKTLITGSFNFTTSAETRNAENLLVLDSAELARLYMDEWVKHRSHSEPW